MLKWVVTNSSHRNSIASSGIGTSLSSRGTSTVSISGSRSSTTERCSTTEGPNTIDRSKSISSTSLFRSRTGSSSKKSPSPKHKKACKDGLTDRKSTSSLPDEPTSKELIPPKRKNTIAVPGDGQLSATAKSTGSIPEKVSGQRLSPGDEPRRHERKISLPGDITSGGFIAGELILQISSPASSDGELEKSSSTVTSVNSLLKSCEDVGDGGRSSSEPASPLTPSLDQRNWRGCPEVAIRSPSCDACFSCGFSIKDESIHVEGTTALYHAHCFLCHVCDQPLHQEFYVDDDGRLLCRKDKWDVRKPTDCQVEVKKPTDCQVDIGKSTDFKANCQADVKKSTESSEECQEDVRKSTECNRHCQVNGESSRNVKCTSCDSQVGSTLIQVGGDFFHLNCIPCSCCGHQVGSVLYVDEGTFFCKLHVKEHDGIKDNKAENDKKQDSVSLEVKIKNDLCLEKLEANNNENTAARENMSSENQVQEGNLNREKEDNLVFEHLNILKKQITEKKTNPASLDTLTMPSSEINIEPNQIKTTTPIPPSPIHHASNRSLQEIPEETAAPPPQTSLPPSKDPTTQKMCTSSEITSQLSTFLTPENPDSIPDLPSTPITTKHFAKPTHPGKPSQETPTYQTADSPTSSLPPTPTTTRKTGKPNIPSRPSTPTSQTADSPISSLPSTPTTARRAGKPNVPSRSSTPSTSRPSTPTSSVMERSSTPPTSRPSTPTSSVMERSSTPPTTPRESNTSHYFSAQSSPTTSRRVNASSPSTSPSTSKRNSASKGKSLFLAQRQKSVVE